MDMIRFLRPLFLVLIALAAVMATGTMADAHEGHGNGHATAAVEVMHDSGAAADGYRPGSLPCHEAATPERDPAGDGPSHGGKPPAGSASHGCAGAWGCCLAIRRDVEPGRTAPPGRAMLALPASDARAGRTPVVESRPPIRDRD